MTLRLLLQHVLTYLDLRHKQYMATTPQSSHFLQVLPTYSILWRPHALLSHMICTGSRKNCFSFGIFLDRNAVSLRYHRVPFDEQLAPPVAPGIDSALIVDRMPD